MSVKTDIAARTRSTSVNGFINAPASLFAVDSFRPYVRMFSPYFSLERSASSPVSPPAGVPQQRRSSASSHIAARRTISSSASVPAALSCIRDAMRFILFFFMILYLQTSGFCMIWKVYSATKRSLGLLFIPGK